ncbi:MAG: ketoacyl-ACP synthase III [Odoribacter sp.]|nr:ketoacyl-ACP synthase III [Odoribacter sp.]
MYINKLTHYLPENIVPNSYFKAVNGLDDEWIYSRTGIKTRSKAGAEENTNTMGIQAVELAVPTLPFPIEEVDLIIAATYSPYDTVATVAHMVQRRYHIENAQCLSVSAACSSFINAIEIAMGYFAMGKATKALVIGSEHNSAYANETDPQSGHLWGDGAVAVFISPKNYSGNDPRIVDIHTRGLGHIGKADEAVFLRPRNGGIGMPEGRDVFVNACHYMVEALEEVTRNYGKTVQDLNWISSHQANQRIIKTISKQTDIPEERFLMNIEQRGNTGSPSCAISLSENLDKIKPGDLVALTVFGGGYSCGAMLLQF